MTNQYEKLMDALNVINEQAENGNNDYEEEKKRAKAYDLVADFINTNAKR